MNHMYHETFIRSLRIIGEFKNYTDESEIVNNSLH